MNQHTRALLGLSIVFALAGCAVPNAAGGALMAPPTSLGADEVKGPAGGGTQPAIAPAYPHAPGDGTAHAGTHADGHTHAQHSYFPDRPNAQASSAPDPEAVSFRRQVVPVLRDHCASCHTAGGPGALALTMFDAAGEPIHANVKQQIGRMLLELQAGRMPKGQPYSLTADEFNTLDRWGAAEMPDN